MQACVWRVLKLFFSCLYFNYRACSTRVLPLFNACKGCLHLLWLLFDEFKRPSQIATRDIGLQMRMCCGHLFSNRWWFLGKLHNLWVHLKIHLPIFFDILIHTECRLRIIVYLLYELGWLLLGESLSYLSLIWSNILRSHSTLASFFASEKELYFLGNCGIGRLLGRENTRSDLLTLHLCLKLINRRIRSPWAASNEKFTVGCCARGRGSKFDLPLYS